MDFYAKALELHAQHHGKVEIQSKVPIVTRDDLSVAYTPGVAEPCRAIAANPDDVWTYTSKANTVAVVTNGTAVLGLGNIGAAAALPVMEGKCVLFKRFAGVDAVPICLDLTDKDRIIATVKALAPTYGGINLEDISSPDCFEIEQTLERELDIPVFHDDQHGTAIVVTSAVINALRVVGKNIEDIKIVHNGVGAAGAAIINMLLTIGAKNILAVDVEGILNDDMEGLTPHKMDIARKTNREHVRGGLAEAIQGADLFVGTSVANILNKDMVRSMNKDAIVFAMANPVPEISYEDAVEAGAAVVGTGRSDNPNQVNNVLCFPGLFKGALMARARDITPGMKAAAANALASLVSDEELAADNIIVSVLDERVGDTLAKAVAQAAVEDGVARNPELL